MWASGRGGQAVFACYCLLAVKVRAVAGSVGSRRGIRRPGCISLLRLRPHPGVSPASWIPRSPRLPETGNLAASEHADAGCAVRGSRSPVLPLGMSWRRRERVRVGEGTERGNNKTRSGPLRAGARFARYVCVFNRSGARAAAAARPRDVGVSVADHVLHQHSHRVAEKGDGGGDVGLPITRTGYYLPNPNLETPKADLGTPEGSTAARRPTTARTNEPSPTRRGGPAYMAAKKDPARPRATAAAVVAWRRPLQCRRPPVRVLRGSLVEPLVSHGASRERPGPDAAGARHHGLWSTAQTCRHARPLARPAPRTRRRAAHTRSAGATRAR